MTVLFILIDGSFAGLINALKLIEPIKNKYSNITYADLFQLASATAIEVIELPISETKINSLKIKKGLNVLMI